MAFFRHRTKFEEYVNGNVAETCETVPETRRISCVSASGFVTVTGVSVAAYTAEPDHFLCLFRSIQLVFAQREMSHNTQLSSLAQPNKKANLHWSLRNPYT